MISKRDNIYYNYIIKKIIPKNMWLLLYCKIRKAVTIRESPSKIAYWQLLMDYHSIIEGMEEGLKDE